jgi:hypothetical protein
MARDYTKVTGPDYRRRNASDGVRSDVTGLSDSAPMLKGGPSPPFLVSFEVAQRLKGTGDTQSECN